MSQIIFQAIESTGPRSTKSLGFFQNEAVATAVAAEAPEENGSVEPVIVCTSSDPATYKQERLVLVALAKLTDEEKSALGLG